MIINLFNTDKHPFGHKVLRYLKVLVTDFANALAYRHLFYDSIKLKDFFQLSYPKLKLDIEGNSKCISCKLCEEVCPTQAIQIKKANMTNMKDSLTEGEPPLHFYLNVSNCIMCGQCQEVCYVDALELTEKYSAKKIDLV